MALNKCRLCLDAGELTNIFEKQGDVMISTKIMSLAKIEICPHDGLPDKVCLNCLMHLNSCLQFIQKCESVDFQLRTQIKENIERDSKEHITESKKGTEGSDEKILKDESCTEDSTLSESVESLPVKYGCCQRNEKTKRKVQKEQCSTCGKVLSSKYRLKMHQRIHTGEKPYSCLDCGKSFSQPENLKVHLRIHTGEKPLECTVCGVLFAHSSGLLAHKRKHTGQLPYKCTLCPRSFRTLGHLQYHIRRHTGETSFECDNCSRAFITRGELKQHILSHSGDKPHICSDCGVRFGRASNLRRHVRHQHNEEKPYSCNKCSHKFAQKSDLERHKKKHEKQKN